MYFDEEIRQKILNQSNLHSIQKGKNYQPITDRELFGFDRINFFMGHHQLPSWHNYWSTDPDAHVGLVTEVMPWNHLGDVLSMFHINDNLKVLKDNTDRSSKLRPLIDGMNEQFA